MTWCNLSFIPPLWNIPDWHSLIQINRFSLSQNRTILNWLPQAESRRSRSASLIRPLDRRFAAVMRIIECKIICWHKLPHIQPVCLSTDQQCAAYAKKKASQTRGLSHFKSQKNLVFLLLFFLSYDFFTSFLINNFHRQTHLAAIVKAHQFHLNFLAFFNQIAWVINTLVRHL